MFYSSAGHWKNPHGKHIWEADQVVRATAPDALFFKLRSMQQMGNDADMRWAANPTPGPEIETELQSERTAGVRSFD
jgi:hypothetical protein